MTDSTENRPWLARATILLRHLPGWVLYQTALTRTTPEGRPASITYSTAVTEEERAA